MTKFVFLTDVHYGYERHQGQLRPLHDIRAFNAMLQFLEDFRPDEIIAGGDILDCGAISHHNKGKPGNTEGMRLLDDAEGCARDIFRPLERLGAKRLTYILGNHEDWLADLDVDNPALTGLHEPKRLMSLDQWNVIPQGGRYSLGKLWFVHGDTLTGAGSVAKKSVTDGGRSLRFGHFHTYAAATKTSFLDETVGHTGIAVPCLCSRDPKYGQGKGNSWIQGFNWGYVQKNGNFSDYVSIITEGEFIAGKRYRGKHVGRRTIQNP